MASNPPLFQAEDQTDEDFFDKLVEDDFEPGKVVTPPTKDVGIGDGYGYESEDVKMGGSGSDSEFDEAKAFGNLSIDEKGIGNLSINEKGKGNLSIDPDKVVTAPTEVVGFGDGYESEGVKLGGFSLDNEFDRAKAFGNLSTDDMGIGNLSVELDKVGTPPTKVVGFGDEKESEDVKVGGLSLDNEFDEANAFGNLSIDEKGSGNLSIELDKVGTPPKVVGFGDGYESEDVKVGLGLNNESHDAKVLDKLTIDKNGVGERKESSEDGVGGELEGSLGLVGIWSVNEVSNDGEGSVGVNDNGRGFEVKGDSSGEKDGGSGVKEVGWSSLFADSGQNDGGDFGSEFFMGIGANSGGGEFSSMGDYSGEFGNFDGSVAGGMDVVAVAGNEEHKSDSFYSSLSYAQYFEGHAYSGSVDNSNDQQDIDSSQYWESLYPGWKYDSNTGQWYQVDAQDSTANVLVSHDATTSTSEWDAVPEQKSEMSYLQKTVQPLSVIAAENGTTENVSTWNQASPANDGWKNSQHNSGYPEHMLFYPEYPGWYFDMIAQEWRTVESYTSSIQSTGQNDDHQKNDGPNSAFSNYNNNSYGEYGQTDNYCSPAISSQGQGSSWVESCKGSTHQDISTWQPDTSAKIDPVSYFGENQLAKSAYSLMTSASNQNGLQNSHSFGAMPSYGNASFQTQAKANGSVFPEFVRQPFSVSQVEQNERNHFSNGFSGSREPTSTNCQSFQSGQQFPSVSSMERSSAGRPAHGLVTFGFGGKLVVMKNNSSFSNSSYGSQDVVGGCISVLNLSEIVMENTDATSVGVGSCGYFSALCKESFPGPLVNGNAGTKELNKWIDERIANSESPDVDSSTGRILKLLFSLLKIACQHYGKLRSPFGTDTAMMESDTPETAVAKLFASAKNDVQFNQYCAINQCVQNLPSEAQIQAIASEVQTLLVSGRRQEALQCAQEGQLWGPAIVLASQLGHQFYVDAVKQMALRQLVAGSPLRTLCLLIAGQPAEVFSTDTTGSNVSSAMNFSQQQAQYGANIMLDDWEENLAVITANRTKDDELVIIHLGDCLWKERSNIVAAHICYLVAEANFESHSNGARLCLVGADHWRYPRTYASPEAIQRTELYEYSKVLGNSQFILLPFQPYKLIYAHMLAEVGRVSDSLKYCQAVLKSLKTGRAPEVETWKQLVSSLEERIRAHQQGGYTGNLAPKKIVGKLLDFFDSTAHKVVGGIPPPAPSTAHGNVQGNDHYTQSVGNTVSSSQSTMAMSSLMPSASMERISEWSSDGNTKAMQNRSVSEPDFSRSPAQVVSSDEKQSSDAKGKQSGSSGSSRFPRFGFGSQILQRTVGLVLKPRPGRQAKLGEENKFYYNEKLKMWVEEGSEPPAEEAALPPPPTTAPFQNGMSDFNSTSVAKNEMAPPYSSPEYKSPTPADHSSGIPPMAPSSNQFSARGRMGVRARYVDTFNKGGGPSANSFQSSSVPSIKPTVAANAKFFIPTPAVSVEQTTETMAENNQQNIQTSESPLTYTATDSVQNHAPPPSEPMQRFPSMDNISRKGQSMSSDGPLSSHSRRTASWSGSLGDTSDLKLAESKPPREALVKSPQAFSQNSQTSLHKPSNSGSFGDDLHEVEL